MTVKIKDVAKKSGVSVATVSRVLNGGKNVSDEVKEVVQNAIEELGYSPSYIARSLVKKKTNLIGVIVPDLTSSFFSTILSSIEENASSNDYNIVVCNIEENLDKEFKYLNLFEQMRVDGIIIMHEKTNTKIKEFINELHIPIIFCSCKGEGTNSLSIIVDDYNASYDAAKYLLNLGHKKIAYIGGDMRDITSGQSRYNGYKKALEDYGISLDDKYVKYGDYKMNSGYNLMNELIKYDPVPTAVFAASDDMAVGALNCIIDNGYRVPEDISIMGFDGSGLTEIVRPKLTSMQQPIREMGAVAIKMIIDNNNLDSYLLNQIIMKHKLVERESCRKI